MRNKGNIKNSIFIWLARIIFLIALLIDVKIFVFPMTLDAPRVITEHYKKITGTVESIQTNVPEKEGRTHKWFEKVEYVYFTEQTSGNTLKIEFHANYNQEDIGYNINTIYYLPHTKWGIKVE